MARLMLILSGLRMKQARDATIFRRTMSVMNPAPGSFRDAYTLIENVFAMAIVALFFGALYALNSQCLYLLNSGRGAAIAQQSLQDRMDQLRNCTWSQLTNAAYLQSSVLNSSTNGSGSFGTVTETVTVNAYPVALSPAISVVRSGGTASTASSNVAIANSDMVRVDVALVWSNGPGRRSRTQAATTVIAKNSP